MKDKESLDMSDTNWEKDHEEKEEEIISENIYEWLIGETLVYGEEEFFLKDFIGEGGMAGVFKADWKQEDNEPWEVAIKIPDPKSPQHLKDRFAKEARITERYLEHPNIVEVYLHGVGKLKKSDRPEAESIDFLVMEFIKNSRKLEKEKEPLEIGDLHKIVGSVAKALIHAHNESCIHRDIKPANILVNEETVKLTDFGLAKIDLTKSMEVSRTAEGQFLGTAYYMAPEQVLPIKKEGKSKQQIQNLYTLDIYGLGATAYRLAKGRPPFDGQTAAAIILKAREEEPEPIVNFKIKSGEIQENLPSDEKRRLKRQEEIRKQLIEEHVQWHLEDLILRSIAKDPDQRPISANDFSEEWEEIKELRLDEVALKELKGNLERMIRLEDDKTKRKAQLFIESMKTKGGSLNLLDKKLKLDDYHYSIIKACLKIEKQNLTGSLQSASGDANIDTKIDLVRGIERLLSLTPRTKENINERIKLLEEAKDIYSALGNRNKEDSLRNRLDWEKNRREYYGIREEKPVISFWQKNRLTFYVSALALVTVAAVGHIAGTSLKSYLGRREAKHEAVLSIKDLEQRIRLYKFEACEEDLKKLIVLAGKTEDEKIREDADRLTNLLKEKNEEHRINQLFGQYTKRIEEAYQTLLGSKKEGSDKVKQKESLLVALHTLDEVKKELRNLTREQENELRDKIEGFVEEFGTLVPALERYGEADANYKEIEKKYQSLQEAVEKAKKGEATYPSRETLVTLQDDLDVLRSILKNRTVQKHFVDDPDFISLSDKIKKIDFQLGNLDSNLSSSQFNRARELITQIDQTAVWLNKNYFEAEALEKDKQFDAYKKEIETLLKNLNPVFFTWNNNLSLAQESLDKIVKDYQTRDIIRQIGDLRQKSKAGDESAAVTLIKIFSEKELYEQAEDFYGQVKNKGLIEEWLIDSAARAFESGDYGKAREWFGQVNDEESKKEHHINVYIKAIDLEKKIADEKKQLLVRNGLSSAFVDRYQEAVKNYLEGNDLDGTSIYLMLEKMDSIPELQEAVGKTKESLKPLSSAAWKVRELKEKIEYEKKPEEGQPESEQLKKFRTDYQAALTGFLEIAKKYQDKVEPAARMFLVDGTREINPYDAWDLAICYEILGVKSKALDNYEKALKSDLLDKKEKEELQASRAGLGN